MKITPDILEKQWNSIGYTDRGFLQIDTQHPLEWHIGYQSTNQRTLLLISGTEIGSIDSSKSMVVNCRKRESDKRWTLSFELLRNEQQGVFAIFCCDVIEHSRSVANEREAIKLVISRYKQWSKLLEAQRSGLMDESSRKGLIGELLFLENRIAVSENVLAAVQGWVGPGGADQDFMYHDGWFEVKSIGLSTASITISSLEQLDRSDAGELVIQRIDKVAPENYGAFSLNDVVCRIIKELSVDADALSLFRTKLDSYGYIDLDEYSRQKYHHSRTQMYRIDDSFPRLTTKTVPSQVISTHYELSISSLTGWEKE